MTKDPNDRAFLIRGGIFGFAAFVATLIMQDPFWSAVSFSFILLILKMSMISEGGKTRWAVLKIALVPLFVGALTPIYSPLGNIAFAAILPILGFMILFTLIYTSEFKTNFQFTAIFIFLFSLAAGALSGIGRFMSDRFLETRYLLGNEYLMVEFLVIMVFGLLGTLIFIRHKDSHLLRDSVDSKIEQLKSKFRIKSGYSKSHFFKLLDSYFWSKEERSLILTSRVLQIGILVLVFYNLTIENLWAFSVALPSFVLSIIPPLYSRFLRMKVSPSFQFWIATALFAYSAGESLRFQSRFGWWNDFTHLMAGIIFGALILIYLFYLRDISDNLHIPSKMIPILVLTFILSISVLWETFEFMVDSLFGTSLQPSLQDTVHDIIANTFGAFLALLIADILTPFETITKVLNHKKEKNLDDISLPSLKKMSLANVFLPSLRFIFTIVGIIGILIGLLGVLIFAISGSLAIPSRINLIFVLSSIISIIVLLVIFILSINALWEMFETLLDCIIEKKRT